jgi:hypothetical protein
MRMIICHSRHNGRVTPASFGDAMKNGIIIKFKDESKCWIVLYVAKKDLKKVAVKQEGF